MNSIRSEMRAVVFDGTLRYVDDYRSPAPGRNRALIRVRAAGICGTDLELMEGYREFSGVLGHEFIGTVAQSDDDAWHGKRVVGEINVVCGTCERCTSGLDRHCANRRVLGIQGLDGCMADYCALPTTNLVEVPAAVSDDRAIFIEPLSAACAILERINPGEMHRAVVLGDGRLGILCAWVLSTTAPDVTLVGRHPEKLALARWRTLKTAPASNDVRPGADMVVDATGSAEGFATAVSLCRPRGVVVLKSTVASRADIDLTPVVINELTVAGSRCGRFRDGLRMLTSTPDMPLERLITARFPIERAPEAFARAARPDALKVLIEMHR